MNEPSVVVKVALAVPTAMATTLPSVTVANSGLSTVHLPDLSVASVGVTDAVSVSLAPTLRLKAVLLRLTPVTLFLPIRPE